MKALPSDNRLFAKINMNFVVKIREPNDKDWRLTTAKKLNDFVKDEELTQRIFNDVLTRGEYITIKRIRKRLKIKFSSK